MKIGIDLGGSHVGVGLIENYELRQTVDRFFTNEDKDDMEGAVIRNIDELINQLLYENKLSMDQIESIGVASPGTISNGHIYSTNLGLNNFDLLSVLKEKYNKPTRIRNDGKWAALAEKKLGALKGYYDCVFINIGTGVGGAAFIDGMLLEPQRYSGFEFGHMTIVRDGLLCPCGKKGCFEQYASIRSLKNRVIKKLGMEGQDISGQYLREVLLPEHKDELQDEVNDFIDGLRVGICNLIDIFEPEIICLGGSFSYYEGHPIYEKLMEEIHRPDATFNKGELPKIVTAQLKNDAGIIGATIDY